MDDHLWIFLDNRGRSRPIEEIWVPDLGVDIIWMTAPVPDEEINLGVGSTPTLELSPADVAALSAEFTQASGRVLVVFDSISALAEAANFGLSPRRVTIVAANAEDGVRVAPNVFFNETDNRNIARLLGRGFEIFIQPLPNVTPRPWTGFAATAQAPNGA